MGADTATELLQLAVTVGGIRLGRCVEVVLDDAGERVIGVVVLCGDASERFLVLDAAQVRDGEITVSSAFPLLDDVEFYRRRGRSLTELR